MRNIVLASTSERKKRLFSLLGLPFKTVDHKYDEDGVIDVGVEKLVVEIAKGKVNSIRDLYPDSIVIGLDTVVHYDNVIMGKPKNIEDALVMLQKLNGTVHQVMTGLYILDTKNDRDFSEVVVTKMYFKKLGKDQLINYIKKEDVLGVAGAYNHEELGCVLLDKIDGDYYNSIGIPISRIADILQKFDINILNK